MSNMISTTIHLDTSEPIVARRLECPEAGDFYMLKLGYNVSILMNDRATFTSIIDACYAACREMEAEPLAGKRTAVELRANGAPTPHDADLPVEVCS